MNEIRKPREYSEISGQPTQNNEYHKKSKH